MAYIPHAKRAKISVYRLKGKKHRAGSWSIIILTPTKTKRGKITYTEVDATLYYEPTNKEGESSKRKAPFSFWTSITALLKKIFQGEASYLDDQKPYVSKITKVGLMLSYMICRNECRTGLPKRPTEHVCMRHTRTPIP